MKNNDLTHGLWRASAPPGPTLDSIQGPHKTDVAIIGGGYTGLSAALHLAKAGCDTILLEAEDIGFGGAGRNVGLVNAGLWLMPDDVIKILGPLYGERVLTALGGSPDLVFNLIEDHGIQCEAMPRGTLHCAHSPGGFRALQEREKQWKRRGAPVRLLGQGEAVARTGSKAFYGALLDERAGTIQPLAYARGLAKAALDNGARLFTGSPVTALEPENNGWRLTTPEGSVTAGSVIMAVQGYPGYALQDQIHAMVPFNFFQFATRPLPESVLKTILPGKQGAWDTHPILSSYRLDKTGRLIVGSVGTVAGFAFDLHRAWAKRTLNKLFPQIKEVRLDYGWHGRIAMTTDHVPRFYLMDKTLATVTCYNGRGIGPGTLFGKLLAELMMGADPNEMPLPAAGAVKPVFLRNLRGWFYESGARLYHLVQRRL